MDEITYAIIGGLFLLAQGVTVAIIAGLFQRENKKRAEDNAKIEKRAAIRAEESMLAMRLMSANTSLACATGLALKEGRTNGKMDIALAEAGKAQADYFKFINDVASKQMAAE
jgi:hypothetical protein